MERLTMIDGCGNDELVRCMDCGLEKAGEDLENCGMCEEGWQRALKRLAAYEDTGLEPCEYAAMRKAMEKGERAKEHLLYMSHIIRNIGLDRVMELLKAEQEGRLVVLPCKVGDTVYRVIRTKNGGGHVAPEVVSGIHMGDTTRNRRYRKGVEYIVLKVDGCFCAHVDLKKIGKTVFLTREEAEAALTLEGGANMTDGAEKPYDRSGDDAESAAIDDPEWKERMMQKFVGRR